MYEYTHPIETDSFFDSEVRDILTKWLYLNWKNIFTFMIYVNTSMQNCTNHDHSKEFIIILFIYLLWLYFILIQNKEGSKSKQVGESGNGEKQNLSTNVYWATTIPSTISGAKGDIFVQVKLIAWIQEKYLHKK